MYSEIIRAARNTSFKAPDICMPYLHALTNEYLNICLYIFVHQLQAYKLIQENMAACSTRLCSVKVAESFLHRW